MNYKISNKSNRFLIFWKFGVKWASINLKFHLFPVILVLIFGLLYGYYNYFWSDSFLYMLLGYSMPIVFLGHLVICLAFLFMRPKSVFVLFLPFFLSGDFVKSLVVFNSSIQCAKPELNILNYNVGTFDLFRFYKKSEGIQDTTYELPQVEFLIASKADVICLQEFYNNDLVGSEAVINLLSSAGYKYFYTNPKHIDYSKGFYGVITFSRYPIVKSGSIDFNYSKEVSRIFNHGIYSDIIVKNDTVRVVNVHLHSMSLQLGEIKKITSWNQLMYAMDEMYDKIQSGTHRRIEQVSILGHEIDNSPFPVLICGDFNDLPSSYTYRYLKRKLANVHEAVGFGFGFTYNKEPWFIRIDNQFYGPRITPKYSRVITNNTLSDHYPLIAGYDIVSN